MKFSFTNTPTALRHTAIHLLTSLLLVGFLAFPNRAEAEDGILLTGGKVFPVDSEPIEGGDLLLAGDRIIAVGKSVDPAAHGLNDVRVIDASGKWILPGFFSPYTQIGLVEVSLVSSVNDTGERSGPTNPQLRVIDAINPEYSIVAIQRVNGVTSVLTAPTGNLIAGQGAVIHLGGGSIDECLIKAPASLHLNFGEAARASEGKKPQTRMGVMGMLREKFYEAEAFDRKLQKHEREVAKFKKDLQNYNSKKAEADANNDQEALDELKDPGFAPLPPERNLEMEPLVAALHREIPVIARAHRVDDIDSAMRFADEFDLQLILLGASNAYKIADRLAEQNIPVLLSTLDNPSSMEKQGALYTNAARLKKAGVDFAIYASDTSHNVRNLPWEAGFAVSYGLNWDDALEAITLAPARILGVEDELGSLTPGKMGNVVVTDGDPFQPLSHVEHVFIAGIEISLETRQTKLAAPYLNK